jgi:hypothetical protein
MPRRLLHLFLGVLAVLQGMSPLLHAHVIASDGGQTGLHVHAVAIGPARGCQSTVSFTLAGVAEPAAITAPTEHRRDESLAGAASAALTSAAPAALTAVHASSKPTCVASVPMVAAALRIPPAQGPPAAT